MLLARVPVLYDTIHGYKIQYRYHKPIWILQYDSTSRFAQSDLSHSPKLLGWYPSPRVALEGSFRNWFSALSLWYTQEISGAWRRSPTKPNVFMLRLHARTSSDVTKPRASSTLQLLCLKTHPGFTSVCDTYTLNLPFVCVHGK